MRFLPTRLSAIYFKLEYCHFDLVVRYLIVIFELVKRIFAAAVVSSLNIFKFYLRWVSSEVDSFQGVEIVYSKHDTR